MFLRGVLYSEMCIRSSHVLHLRMLTSLLGAQMRIFDLNPSGRILNRFSKDLGIVDETMPIAMAQSSLTLLYVVGIICVVVILNPVMLIILGGSFVFVVMMLKLYNRAAQDLKRLEGSSKICLNNLIANAINSHYLSSQSSIFSSVS